jgi:hypothetical protein
MKKFARLPILELTPIQPRGDFRGRAASARPLDLIAAWISPFRFSGDCGQ